MSTKTKLISLAFLSAVISPIFADEQVIEDLNHAFKTTWTHTYLKSKNNQPELLKEYIVHNWFAMDEIAVDKGLFRDYRLLENPDTSENRKWDVIVAVEYFGNETYSNIAKAFEDIRSAHELVEVPGFEGREGFDIVNGNSFSVADKFRGPLACESEQLDMLKPFFGTWFEIDAEDETHTPFGLLEFSIEPQTCSTFKRFNLLGREGGYISIGHFNKESETWFETFNSGIQFKWLKKEDGVYMYNLSTNLPEGYQRRNQWLPIDMNRFSILVQQSQDNGKTWKQISEVKLERR